LQLGRQQLALARQAEQDEAEFAGLREVEAGAQGDAGRGAEDARQHGDEGELEQHRQQREDDHERPARQHDAEVELHADGDEEEAEQDVVERPDVGLDLVLELGLGDQHAGDEGAERARETRHLGQPRQPERDEEQVEDEQLLALPAHDQRQPPAHDDAAADQQTARSAAAFSVATASSRSSTSGVEPSAGMITSSGTTARSWNRSTAMTRRPCSLSSSRRSAISLTTIAVELIASAAPSAIALCQPRPQWRPVAVKSETAPRCRRSRRRSSARPG
jgi:hypothetical protein